MRIVEAAIYQRLENVLVGKVADKGPQGLKKGTKITSEFIASLEKDELFKLRMHDNDANDVVEQLADQVKEQRKVFDEKFEEKKGKITRGDDLAPGVLKMVKVYHGRQTSYSAG